MRAPGLKLLKHGARWVRSRFVPGALILGYHRIVDATRDPYSMCVSPNRFAQQLEVLRQWATPMRLWDVVQSLRDGTLPPRAVALTFDDGYTDQLLEAKPLLEKYNIPATVFVTTGYLGGEFWWNELEEILYRPSILPQQLSLYVKGEPFKWSCTPAHYSGADGESRRSLLFSLYQSMLQLTADQQRSLLAELREWTGAGVCKRESVALTREQLVRLAAGDLIDIGAHSVSHPLLNSLSPTMQRSEIQESKSCLEALLAHPVQGFSYPNGAFSELTQAIVQQAGFLFACASYNDVTRRGCRLYDLPRFWIGDWDRERFSRWLQRWTRGR
jgi:peptidoglycan/xylan/chitin deacetylase (PgdA/CDA1 family)